MWKASIRELEGALLIIDRVALERYVASVIQAEGGALPPAALEAQAVVSRSYAVAQLGRHRAFDFCDLTHCQLDRAEDPLPAVQLAMKHTAGKVLREGEATVPAFFHSACGGATSSSSDVFREGTVKGVSDLKTDGTALCAAAEGFDWQWELKSSELERALSLPPAGETRILRRDAAGRALELVINGRKLAGPLFLADVTRRVGYQGLRSLRFSVERRGDSFLFKGRGVGHGVGFCQAGAAALARGGKSGAEILKHYFPDAEVGYLHRPK